jgi:hypothetical protein
MTQSCSPMQPVGPLTTCGIQHVLSVDLSSSRLLSGANIGLPARRSNRLPSCRAHWLRWWSNLDRRSQTPFSNRLCGLLHLAISPRWRSTFVVEIRQSGWRDKMQAAFPKGRSKHNPLAHMCETAPCFRVGRVEGLAANHGPRKSPAYSLSSPSRDTCRIGDECSAWENPESCYFE